MAFVTTVPVAQAAGDELALYQRYQDRLGYVPNFAKLFSLRPHVATGWEALLTSVRRTLDARRYELVTLAAARALCSSYCALAHGDVLRKQFFTAPELAAIAEDFARAPLAPVDVAIMAFAEKVARDASAITAADVDELRKHGLGDAEIFDIAAAAAARCFFSKLLDALGAEPDSSYAKMEDVLRPHLTVGRPIATSPVETLPVKR